MVDGIRCTPHAAEVPHRIAVGLASAPLTRRTLQLSSADCLAALVASVIKRLRREEAGQATVFSKRAFSHFFQESFRCGSTRIFLLSVVHQ